MHRIFAKTMACVLCVTAMSAPAFATEVAPNEDLPLLIATQDAVVLQPTKLWGQLTWEDDDTFLLENQATESSYIIHTDASQTLFIDAVTGAGLDATTLQNGDTVYVYAGPAMTMSLPPQTSAVMVIGNIPAGFGVPSYYLVDGAISSDDETISIPVGEETLEIPTTVTLETVDGTAVQSADITTDTGILVWYDMTGNIHRVMVMADVAPSSQLLIGDDLSVTLEDVALAVPAKMVDDTLYLPLRAIGEAMGYTVYWDSELGACVTQDEAMIYAIYPDGTTSFLENGVTYVEATIFQSAMGL